MNADITFLSSNVDVASPARCVDGRVDLKSRLGPQMLGGSLHPALLCAIFYGEDFSSETVKGYFATLLEKGFALGAHRGSYQNSQKNVSDCGFADRTYDIFQAALYNREEISKRIIEIYFENTSSFPKFSAPFESLLHSAYNTLEKYDPERITVSGETLVALVASLGGHVEDVCGKHQENIAYVNLVSHTTFDTKKANTDGWQAFNLDIWSSCAQSVALGVEQNFAFFASFILYAATEVVLVEQKGKAALQIGINS